MFTMKTLPALSFLLVNTIDQQVLYQTTAPISWPSSSLYLPPKFIRKHVEAGNLVELSFARAELSAIEEPDT